MANRFSITAELQVVPNMASLNSAIGTVRQSLQNGGIGSLAPALQKVTTATNSANKAMVSYSATMATAIRRNSAFVIGMGGFYGILRAMKSGIGEAIEFQTQMVKLAQITGRTTSQLRGLEDTIGNLSIEYGIVATKLADVAKILAQSGRFSSSGLVDALNALSMTELAPTFENIGKTAEGAIAIMGQFGTAASDLEMQFGAINAVSKQFAVESGDLIAAVRRAGGAFSAAGGSLNELLGLFTSVRATSRESFESIATGLRTVFTRMQRAKTQSFFEDLGVKLRDQAGEFIGPFEAILEIAKYIERANISTKSATFAQIAEQLGGFRQVSRVIPLLTQTAEAQRVLNVARGGGDSLIQDKAKAMESWAVQLRQVRGEFMKLVRAIGQTDTFTTLIKMGISLAHTFIKIVDSIKPLVPLLAAFGLARGIGLVGGVGKQLLPMLKMKTGGFVPGAGNTDSIHAMLTPGEYVLPKRIVQQVGIDSLERLRVGGLRDVDLPQYNEGGLIEKIKSLFVKKKSNVATFRDKRTTNQIMREEIARNYHATEKTQYLDANYTPDLNIPELDTYAPKLRPKQIPPMKINPLSGVETEELLQDMGTYRENIKRSDSKANRGKRTTASQVAAQQRYVEDPTMRRPSQPVRPSRFGTGAASRVDGLRRGVLHKADQPNPRTAARHLRDTLPKYVANTQQKPPSPLKGGGGVSSKPFKPLLDEQTKQFTDALSKANTEKIRNIRQDVESAYVPLSKSKTQNTGAGLSFQGVVKKLQTMATTAGLSSTAMKDMGINAKVVGGALRGNSQDLQKFNTAISKISSAELSKKQYSTTTARPVGVRQPQPYSRNIIPRIGYDSDHVRKKAERIAGENLQRSSKMRTGKLLAFGRNTVEGAPLIERTLQKMAINAGLGSDALSKLGVTTEDFSNVMDKTNKNYKNSFDKITSAVSKVTQAELDRASATSTIKPQAASVAATPSTTVKAVSETKYQAAIRDLIHSRKNATGIASYDEGQRLASTNIDTGMYPFSGGSPPINAMSINDSKLKQDFEQRSSGTYLDSFSGSASTTAAKAATANRAAAAKVAKADAVKVAKAAKATAAKAAAAQVAATKVTAANTAAVKAASAKTAAAKAASAKVASVMAKAANTTAKSALSGVSVTATEKGYPSVFKQADILVRKLMKQSSDPTWERGFSTKPSLSTRADAVGRRFMREPSDSTWERGFSVPPPIQTPTKISDPSWKRGFSVPLPPIQTPTKISDPSWKRGFSTKPSLFKRADTTVRRGVSAIPALSERAAATARRVVRPLGILTGLSDDTVDGVRRLSTGRRARGFGSGDRSAYGTMRRNASKGMGNIVNYGRKRGFIGGGGKATMPLAIGSMVLSQLERPISSIAGDKVGAGIAQGASAGLGAGAAIAMVGGGPLTIGLGIAAVAVTTFASVVENKAIEIQNAKIGESLEDTKDLFEKSKERGGTKEQKLIQFRSDLRSGTLTPAIDEINKISEQQATGTMIGDRNAIGFNKNNMSDLTQEVSFGQEVSTLWGHVKDNFNISVGALGSKTRDEMRMEVATKRKGKLQSQLDPFIEELKTNLDTMKSVGTEVGMSFDELAGSRTSKDVDNKTTYRDIMTIIERETGKTVQEQEKEYNTVKKQYAPKPPKMIYTASEEQLDTARTFRRAKNLKDFTTQYKAPTLASGPLVRADYSSLISGDIGTKGYKTQLSKMTPYAEPGLVKSLSKINSLTAKLPDMIVGLSGVDRAGIAETDFLPELRKKVGGSAEGKHFMEKLPEFLGTNKEDFSAEDFNDAVKKAGGIINFSANAMKSIFSEQIETGAALAESQQIVADLWIKRSSQIAQQTLVRSNTLGDLERGKLAQTQLRSKFGLGSFARASASDEIVRKQVKSVSGTSSVSALGAKLQDLRSQYTDIQSRGGAGDAGLQLEIQTTTTSLKKMSEAGLRTATTLDTLNKLESARASQISSQEGFLNADASGRSQILTRQADLNSLLNKKDIISSFGGLSDDKKRDRITALRTRGDKFIGKDVGLQLGFKRDITGNEAASELLTPRSSAIKELQKDSLAIGADANKALSFLDEDSRAELGSLNNSLNAFVTAAATLSSTMNQMPIPSVIKIEHSNPKVEVVINGAQVLQSILPEIANMIESQTLQSMNDMLNTKFPNAGAYAPTTTQKSEVRTALNKGDA